MDLRPTLAALAGLPNLAPLAVEVLLQPGFDRLAAFAAKAFDFGQITRAYRIFQRLEAIDMSPVEQIKTAIREGDAQTLAPPDLALAHQLRT